MLGKNERSILAWTEKRGRFWLVDAVDAFPDIEPAQTRKIIARLNAKGFVRRISRGEYQRAAANPFALEASKSMEAFPDQIEDLWHGMLRAGIKADDVYAFARGFIGWIAR